MKIQPVLTTIGLSCLLALSWIVLTFLDSGFPLPRVASQSTSASPNIATLPSLNNKSGGNETADLLITKSSSPTIVTVGELLTYTILVTNMGPATAHNLTITDTLPTGVHFQGESTLQLVKGADPQLHVSLYRLTGTVGSLLPTGRVEIIGRTAVEMNGSHTTLLNTAYVTATNDNRSDNNRTSVDTPLLTTTPTPIPPQTPTPTATSTVSPIATAPTSTGTPTVTPTLIATTVPNLADLQIKKSVAYPAVIAGAIVTYTIQINNFGPGLAYNVLIQDRLPEGLAYEGLAHLSILRGEGPKLQITQEQLTATVSVLNVTGIITIAAPVRTLSTAPTAILVNQAIVTSTTTDEQPGNNSAVASLFLIAAPPFTENVFLPIIQR